jgi:hypothetical protein
MNNSERAVYWRKHVDAWAASGLTQVDYADQQGINRKSLGNWIRALRRQQEASVGVVTLVQGERPMAAAPSGGVTLIGVNGCRIELGMLPPAEWVASLLVHEVTR